LDSVFELNNDDSCVEQILKHATLIKYVHGIVKTLKIKMFIYVDASLQFLFLD